MIGLALGFLARAWPYLLAIFVAGVVYYNANWVWCNARCQRVSAERDQLAVEKEAAQARATQLALMWAEQVEKTDEEARQRRAAQDRLANALVVRAKALSSSADIRLSGDAGQLLRDATDFANSATPPAVGSPTADPVPAAAISEADLAAAWVAAAHAYADAKGQWQACVNHYESLANVQ